MEKMSESDEAMKPSSEDKMQFVVNAMYPMRMMLKMAFKKNGSVVLVRGGYTRVALTK